MADKKPQRFDFDPDQDGAEVPTLTKLLYKKNVVKAQGSAGTGRQSQGLNTAHGLDQGIVTLEPTVTIERPAPTTQSGVSVSTKSREEISNQFVRSDIGSNQPQPLSMNYKQAVGSTDRRVMSAATPFSMPMVTRAIAPEKYRAPSVAASGIKALYEKTKIEATLVFEENGDTFVLSTIIAPGNERTTLWSGMEISKTFFSDLCGRLEKFGFAEFSSIGSAGKGNFDRQTFRTAFQAKSSECVTLVRVKDSSGPGAIIAVLSKGSIQVHLPAFHSTGMSELKAA